MKEQAKLYAQNHYMMFDLFPTENNIQEEQNKLCEYLTKIIDNADFQKDPAGYMVSCRQKRGGSYVYRYPEDSARSFFLKALGKIRTLPDAARHSQI